MLRGSPWLIFVDPKDDPFFVEAADEMGVLGGELTSAPVWSSNSGEMFLVLSPDVDVVALGADRLAELERRGFEASGARRRISSTGTRVSAPPGPLSAPPISGRRPPISGRRARKAPDAQPSEPPLGEASNSGD